MKSTLLFNTTVLTEDLQNTILPNGWIYIENGKIVQMGIHSDMPASLVSQADEVIDLNGSITMPGFINTHTHSAMSLLRGFADDMPLKEWLNDKIFPKEATLMTPQNVRLGAKLALYEMLSSGTTCFNDMYFFESILAEECNNVGIRACLAESISNYASSSFANSEQGFALEQELLETLKGDTLIKGTVSVHSPYTCSQEVLKQGRELANQYNTLLHIHVAETLTEHKYIHTKYKTSPVKFLNNIGIFDGDCVAAHSIWLDQKEIELYADKKISIAHCPKSNLKLGSGIADTVRYLKNGINVSIGTDSAASNNALNMVEEMRFASLIPKGMNKNPESISSKEALRMATINGAKALGLDKITGSLEVGKSADLQIINADSPNSSPMYNAESCIVYAMNSTDVQHVMIAGNWVMKNRKIEKLDKEQIIEEIHIKILKK